MADPETGRKVYGYIADSCADKNWWCRRDTFHLDISAAHLDSMGLMAGWNGRKLKWTYMDGPPEECGPPLRSAGNPATCEDSHSAVYVLCNIDGSGLHRRYDDCP